LLSAGGGSVQRDSSAMASIQVAGSELAAMASSVLARVAVLRIFSYFRIADRWPRKWR
jgi:hypothetical protein